MSPVKSSKTRMEINAIKTAIIQKMDQRSSQLLDESTSTREGSSDLSLGKIVDDDSLTTTMINSIVVNHEIVGTNSRLTDKYQISDPNLKWIRDIMKSKDSSRKKAKVNNKDLTTVQKKLLKHLPNLQISKDLIYLVDEDKFGNKRNRHVMPSNEVDLKIKELHWKETAGHLGTEKTIKKIKSRFFWVNLSRDVKKFIKECFDCQKVKQPKAYSVKDSTTRYDGHGRSIASHTERPKIYIVNMQPLYQTHQSFPYENNDSSRSSREVFGLLSDVRNIRRSVDRPGVKLY